MLKQRAIFFFWLPLAFSWLLMTVEGPWVQAVISRKADSETQLAAFGVVMSLSLLIETPVIPFLALGSALIKDRNSYRTLYRYVMTINVIATVIAALMAFTPMLDLWLGKVLGIPPDIVEAARPGMGIMLLWSAFIGYRRFHQGLMIRSGHTRSVGYGTIIRIAVSAGMATLLGLLTNLSGAVIGAIAVVGSVGAECLYAHLASRPDVRKIHQVDTPATLTPLALRSVLNFHIPLVLTTGLTMLARPVLESGLSNTPDSASSLAAWAVIFSIILLMRSGAFAWQEAVIALSKGQQQLNAVRRFTLTMGGGLSLFMAIFAFTPLIDGYLGTVLQIPEHLRPMVTLGARIGILVPLVTAVQSYLRALLMLSGATILITLGTIISFAATAGSMWLGLKLGMPGVASAAAAIAIGTGVEVLIMWRGFATRAERLYSQWKLAAD